MVNGRWIYGSEYGVQKYGYLCEGYGVFGPWDGAHIPKLETNKIECCENSKFQCSESKTK